MKKSNTCPLLLYSVKIFVDFTVKKLATSCQSISRYFSQAPVNIFRNQAQNGSKGHYCFFFVIHVQPYNPTKVFSSTVG